MPRQHNQGLALVRGRNPRRFNMGGAIALPPAFVRGVSQVGGFDGAGNSPGMNLPTVDSAGGVFIAVCVGTTACSFISNTAGWSKIGTNQTDGLKNVAVFVAPETAGAPSFQGDNASSFTWRCEYFKRVGAAMAQVGAMGSAVAGFSSSPGVPSFTTAGNDALVFYTVVDDNGSNAGAHAVPTGFAENSDAAFASGFNIATGCLSFPAPAATGALSAAQAVGSNWLMISLQVR